MGVSELFVEPFYKPILCRNFVVEFWVEQVDWVLAFLSMY